MLSLAVPEAAAQKGLDVARPPCDSGSGIRQYEIPIEFREGASLIAFRVYDSTGAPVAPIFLLGGPNQYQATTVVMNAARVGLCDYLVGFAPHQTPSPADSLVSVLYPRTTTAITVEIARLQLVQGDTVVTGTDRFVYSSGSVITEPKSFFNPLLDTPADVYLEVVSDGTRVSPAHFWATPGVAPTRFMDDVVQDDGWVYPYHEQAFCARVSCPNSATGNLHGPLIMPVDSVFVSGQPFTKRLTPDLSIVLSSTAGVDWSENWLTLAFAPGTRLETRGTFNASGVTFTAADAAQGWGGVRVAGGHATLGAGATVSGVAAPAMGFGPSSAAGVTVTGGSVTLDGAVVQGTVGGAGVYVSGKGASASITGTTEIFSNASGPGVRVDAGGSVTVAGDDVQIYGNAEGVVATGSGSRAYVSGGLIRSNAGPGLRATSGARIDVLRVIGGGSGSLIATSTRAARLTSNAGGLYATGGKQAGGVVNSEAPYVCVQAPCPVTGQHEFRLNNLGPAFDALAYSGSQVLATHNFWGTSDRTAIQTDTLGASVVSIDPILTDPPASGAVAGRDAPNGMPAAGASPALGRGRVDAGVQALLAEADAWVPSGDSVRAGARLLSAWALAATDDDRLAVSEAAGRALLVVQPPALVAWAAGAAGSVGPERPWGRRALALSLAGQSRYAEASAVAQALASEDGAGTDDWAELHRARGFGLLVEVAVASGDAPGAVAALTSLADVDPEGAADAALAVAVAFPDVDVSFVQGAAGRGGVAAKAGAPTDAATAVGGLDLGLAVGPNPAAGTVRVSLTLATGADAAVAVFDALGRRVAVLHEGAAPAGRLAASFDAAALPAGVYVVRAVVRSADGGSSVLARRVVVAR